MHPRSLLCILCTLLAGTRCLVHISLKRRSFLPSYQSKSRRHQHDADTSVARSSRAQTVSAIKSALLQLTALPLLSLTASAAEESSLLVNLNSTQPRITDTCYIDLQIGESSDIKRIEIALFGESVPITCSNFKKLCETKQYKNSDVFRIIPTFSIQAGNIGQPEGARRSEYGNYGRSSLEAGRGFPAENFSIMHSYQGAGIVSMMKDVRNKGLQDSRFFVTLSPYASWADGRYVAFGRVTRGMEAIIGLSVIPTIAPSNIPETSVKIIDCGVL